MREGKGEMKVYKVPPSPLKTVSQQDLPECDPASTMLQQYRNHPILPISIPYGG